LDDGLCQYWRVLGPVKNVQDLLAKNAELSSRLKISDEQNRKLQEENQKLKALQPQNQRLSERVLLLEEEVRWFKEQYFGRSSQKSGSESSPDQKMLFNEAEVLAAIEAAEAFVRASANPDGFGRTADRQPHATKYSVYRAAGVSCENAAGVRRLPAAAVPQKGVNIGGTALADFTKRCGNRHFCARFDSYCLPP
jgi:hypothetical protein